MSTNNSSITMQFQYTENKKKRYSCKSEKDTHYFFSNCLEWRTGTDFKELYDYFTKMGQEFLMFKVRLPSDSDYEIDNYIPLLPRDVIEYIGSIVPNHND
ncbi:hypothetical protein [Hydrogenovibrio marinus]|uniref:Uncharacterized protein n=1 Tax=Hydrogenovibrio marinus TaxID=28885 RepID=A0A066ZWK4_HYDMR|nr:hypothetical protein [Hydrogenovibrio marinus]KDN94701.1 hypothetical protein EI16_12455 [Hydrogenovibrio marinus]